MKNILKPFFLLSALLLTFVPQVYSGENSTQMFSAFDYQQTRERLIKAISDNGLVLFGEFDHAKAAHEAWAYHAAHYCSDIW